MGTQDPLSYGDRPKVVGLPSVCGFFITVESVILYFFVSNTMQLIIHFRLIEQSKVYLPLAWLLPYDCILETSMLLAEARAHEP